MLAASIFFTSGFGPFSFTPRPGCMGGSVLLSNLEFEATPPASKYFNNTAQKDVDFKSKGVSGDKVKVATVTGVHLCCKGCVTASEKAIMGAEGVEGHTAKNKAESFEITGDFSPSDVLRNLRKAGMNAVIAPGGAKEVCVRGKVGWDFIPSKTAYKAVLPGMRFHVDRPPAILQPKQNLRFDEGDQIVQPDVADRAAAAVDFGGDGRAGAKIGQLALVDRHAQSHGVALFAVHFGHGL